MRRSDPRRSIAVLALTVLSLTALAQSQMTDTLFRTDALLQRQLLTAPPPTLGIFCRLDVELDERLVIPVRFRLGDARAVERWEGHGPGDPRLLR